MTNKTTEHLKLRAIELKETRENKRHQMAMDRLQKDRESYLKDHPEARE